MHHPHYVNIRFIAAPMLRHDVVMIDLSDWRISLASFFRQLSEADLPWYQGEYPRQSTMVAPCLLYTRDFDHDTIEVDIRCIIGEMAAEPSPP